MPAGWVAAAGAVMGAMSDDGGGAPSYNPDPRVTQATIDEMNQMRELRQAALNRSNETWDMSKPYLTEGLARNNRLQALSEQQATSAADQYNSKGVPLLDRMYRENVLSPEEEQVQQRRAGSQAMGSVQQQMEGQQAIAARRAAAYGYNPSAGTNINQTVGAATAKAGAGTQASAMERNTQTQKKAGMYDVLSGRESASKSSVGQAFGGGQAGSGMAGSFGQQGTQGFQTAAGISPMNSINSLNQNAQFGAGQNMQAWQTQQNQPSALGQMAQLGMMYYGGNKGGGGGGGGGGSSIGSFWADGGYIGYADGGDVAGEDPFPFLPEVSMGYADGGAPMDEVDSAIPMIERHDGVMTQGDGSGGKLQGPGTGISDDIPAETDTGEPIRVANGEFIIPADVVEALGDDFFNTLIAKFHTPAAIQRGEQQPEEVA